MNIEEKSPVLEAYGVTLEEATEIVKVVEDLIRKHNRRSDVIRDLKKIYKGNKLLYAVGYLEYWAGANYVMTMLRLEAISRALTERGYQ